MLRLSFLLVLYSRCPGADPDFSDGIRDRMIFVVTDMERTVFVCSRFPG